MQDHYYIENTKSTFKSVKAWLLKRGFIEDSYGDSIWNEHNKIGYCYFVKPGIMYKLKYKWGRHPQGHGYISGKMISIEDVTSCYSEILGKKTGY